MSVANEHEITRLEELREVLKLAANLGSDDSDQCQAKEDILEKLRGILNELSTSKNERNSTDAPSMQEFLTELKVLESTSSFLGKCIREFQIVGGRQFSYDDYAAKLLSKLTIKDGTIDWMMLAGDVTCIINRVPGMPMLLGTFSVSTHEGPSANDGRKKQKAVRRAFVVEEPEKEKESPDQIQNMDADENSVDSKVESIMKLLRRYCRENKGNPISFYKFVLHPQSFTTTIENIFHLSFIMRDGLARLDTIGDEIVIEPVTNNESKPQLSGESGHTLSSKYQMVFSISFDEWNNLVRTYNIKKPLIK